MEPTSDVKVVNKRNGRFVAGAILVTIGILTLLGNLVKNVDLAMWIVPAIGLVFLISGLVTRNRGLLIPGGIVGGVGGALIVMQALGDRLTENGKGGLFLLVFSLGWLLIAVLSLVVPNEEGKYRFMYWPLIPGGILAAIGALVIQGESGLQVLNYIGQGWPVVMIGIGLYLLLRRKDMKEE